MAKYRYGFISTILFVVVTSCQKNALLDPYAYTSISHEKVWEANREERQKVKNVVLANIIDIKESDTVYSLGELFDISLRYNPKTCDTWQKAREASAAYGASLGPYFPSIGFEADYAAVRTGFIFQGESLLINEQRAYGPMLNLSYLIWDSGERRANAEAFYQAMQGANWMHNEQIQGVLKDTADAYYNFLYQKAYLHAVEADLLDAEQTYEAARLKLETGIYSSTDMLQAKTSYLQKKVDFNAQQNQVKNSYITLLKSLGIPTEMRLEMGSFPKDPVPSPFNEDKECLVKMAKNLRPDYLAAKTTVLANEAKVRKAKTELMPKINVSASGGTLWYNGGLNDEGNYNVLLNLTLPIFTGFSYINQIRVQESELKSSISDLRAKELMISQEVRTYANNHEMAIQQLKDTKSYLEAAETEFDAMLKRYKHGIVSILDLLSSQSFLSDARAKYTEAERVYYESLIDIAFGVGMLSNGYPQNLEKQE